MKTEIKKIAEIVTYLKRGIAPAYTDDPDGVIVINQKCIREGRLDLSKARRNDLSKKSIPSVKYLRKCDILINSTGVGTLGRICQVKNVSVPMTVDTHVTILRPDPEKVDPIYAGIFLTSLEKQIENLGEGSTGQTELYADVILDLDVQIPDIETQHKVVGCLGVIDDLIEGKLEEIRRLDEFRRKLAPSVLSGQISMSEIEWR